MDGRLFNAMTTKFSEIILKFWKKIRQRMLLYKVSLLLVLQLPRNNELKYVLLEINIYHVAYLNDSLFFVVCVWFQYLVFIPGLHSFDFRLTLCFPDYFFNLIFYYRPLTIVNMYTRPGITLYQNSVWRNNFIRHWGIYFYFFIL